MGQDSNIEWTHHTFNPWMGCTKVSAGCANCYAENLMDTRYGKVKWGDSGTRVIKKDWSEPRKWNKLAEKAGERHRVFCASLADVFEDRPELYEPRARLFSMVTRTPSLDWLFLTKRPQNIMAMLPDVWQKQIPTNVWLGTSIENQATADGRIPHLLRVPAAVRFLSVEPLLSAIDLGRFIGHHPWDRSDIRWVIVGGESGPKARPCDIAWIRSIVEQCKAASVPVFVKQLGAHVVETDSHGEGTGRVREGKKWRRYAFTEGSSSTTYKLRDSKGGDMSEWPEDLRIREVPKC